MIHSVRIRRFRSIDDMTVEFGDLTILVGKNDAGKSNVARALNLFFNNETDVGIPFDFDRDYNSNSKIPDKTAAEVIIEIIFILPASFKKGGRKVKWKKAWRKDGIQELKDDVRIIGGGPAPRRGKIRTALARHRLLVVPAIKDKLFFENLLGDIYDQLSSSNSVKITASGASFNSGLNKDASNLIAGLKSSLDEDFKIELPQNLRPIFEALNIINATGIPFDRRGDGIKIRHIPELLDFLATLIDNDLRETGAVKASHIWIFEEPENNLEFSAASSMANRLNELISEKDNLNILLTTHSPIFYGMNVDNESLRIRHFVSLNQDKNNDKHTVCGKISEGDIDNSMGVLPLIEKAIKPLQDELIETQKIVKTMERKRLNQEKRTIFVEGQTDHIILQKALNVFHQERSSEIAVVRAEWAGAQSAINLLQAWQFLQQHRRAPVKAVSIVDKDAEGIKAIDSMIFKGGKHIKAIFFMESGRAISGLPTGFKPIVDLESLYSDEIWKFAKDNNWIKLRDPQYLYDYCLPDEIKKNIAKANLSPDERFAGLTEQQRIRLEYKFSDRGKVEASKHINRMSNTNAKSALKHFQPTLKHAVQLLFSRNARNR